MKRSCDKDLRFHWTLVALKVGPGASLKPHDSVCIQVIIKRDLYSNTLRTPIDPRTSSDSRPIPYSDQDITTNPPKPPRLTPPRRNVIPHALTHPNISPVSSSGSHGTRIRSLSSSDEERSDIKNPNQISSSSALYDLRPKHKVEEEVRRTVDGRSRKRGGGLGDRGKENKEKDSKCARDLGKVNSNIMDL